MKQQLFGAFFKTFGDLWAQHPLMITFIGLALILSSILRLPAVKGWFGEMIMRLGFSLFLPKTVDELHLEYVEKEGYEWL